MIGEDELLVGTFAIQQAVAHRLIGLSLLSKNQKGEATVHLAECNNLVRSSPEASWARALLARIKDNAEWPEMDSDESAR